MGTILSSCRHHHQLHLVCPQKSQARNNSKSRLEYSLNRKKKLYSFKKQRQKIRHQRSPSTQKVSRRISIILFEWTKCKYNRMTATYNKKGCLVLNLLDRSLKSYWVKRDTLTQMSRVLPLMLMLQERGPILPLRNSHLALSQLPHPVARVILERSETKRKKRKRRKNLSQI